MTKPRRHDRVFSRLLEPASCTERLDLNAIFGRNAPLHVDLGCGNGAFLCELARRTPEKNFLGVERLLGRAQSSARKGDDLENVRVLRLETSYAVRYLLPPAAVEKFYLLFPDPWPKRRHQRRRVVTNEFLDAIGNALSGAGRFHFATDQQDYFEYIKQLAEDRCDFATIEPDYEHLPQTRFQMRFQRQGLPIYRLELRKVSPVM